MRNVQKNFITPLKAKSYTLTASAGYSLIELIVAVGVFAVVITIMSGSFIISLRGQGKSQTAQNVADNTRYAMDVIAKEIRMGKIKAAEGFILNSSSDIQFRSNMPNRNGAIVQFYLDVPTGQIMFDDDISDALAPEPITASSIAVSALTFDVSGASPESQPRIVIVMSAVSVGTAENIATRTDIQTTISPRSL